MKLLGSLIISYYALYNFLAALIKILIIATCSNSTFLTDFNLKRISFKIKSALLK